jgi:DNA-binding protein HU-beta
MYKTEFIRRIARETHLSQRAVAAVLAATQQLIARTLQGGQHVTLPGFGTFYARPRAATRIQHIRTRAVIVLPPSIVAAFRAGEVLKRAVAGKRRGRPRRG